MPWIYSPIELYPQTMALACAGFEPTLPFRASSTRLDELAAAIYACVHHAVSLNKKPLERETGIEPASNAWEAFILPLNYSRSVMPQSAAPSDAVLHSDRKASSSSPSIPSGRASADHIAAKLPSTPAYIPTRRTSLLASPFFPLLKLGSPRRLRSVF